MFVLGATKFSDNITFNVTFEIEWEHWLCRYATYGSYFLKSLNAKYLISPVSLLLRKISCNLVKSSCNLINQSKLMV